MKTLGEKMSGKAKAADAQAVLEANVLAATLALAKEAHASGVKQRLSAATLASVAHLIEALNDANDSGSYAKFEAEGQRQATADAALGLRAPASVAGGPSSASGCFELVSSQKRLFIHPEGGTACVGSRLVLHKDGPEARLCFRFVSEASFAVTHPTPPAPSSRSRSPSPTPNPTDSESTPPPFSSPESALDAGHTAAATSNPHVLGRLQHVESGLFVAPSKAALPSDLILIADAHSSALFAMTPEGHLLHAASAAVVCPAKAKASSGCALQLRLQDSSVLERSVFAIQPFESYSNGHLILRSFCLIVLRKFRKYARALSVSTFVDPKCVHNMHHLSQVSSLFSVAALHSRPLFTSYAADCHFPLPGHKSARGRVSRSSVFFVPSCATEQSQCSHRHSGQCAH